MGPAARRIGVFGGAFDPPHNAHVALVRAALSQLALDALFVFPTGQAWHKPRALSPEGYVAILVSPDGKSVVVTGPDRKHYLYPISGGEPTAIPGIELTDSVDQYTADSRFLYVHRREAPLKVHRLDLATGRKELWRTLMPSDAAGVSSLGPYPTPGGESYVYSYVRTLSDLYIVEGLK